MFQIEWNRCERRYGLPSQKYLFSGQLRKTFANPCHKQIDTDISTCLHRNKSQTVYTPKSYVKSSLNTFGFLPRIYLNFLVFFSLMNLVPQQVGLPEPIILQSDFIFFQSFIIKKKIENCSVVTSCNMQGKDVLDLAPWGRAFGAEVSHKSITLQSQGGDCSSEG